MLRASLVLTLVALPSLAAAGGFIEGVVGVAAPVADDEYDDLVDNSLKLGVRAGSLGASGAGLELGVDYTLVELDTASIGSLELSAYRVRALIGGRFQRPLGRSGFGFARLAGGLDVAHFEQRGTILGFPAEGSQTDLGLALELGGGVGVDLGSVTIAGQFALPLAFHFDDDAADDPEDYDFEYTGVDVDFLLTVGTAF